MEQNVIVSIFDVESEAFQALTEIKQAPAGEKSLLAQAVLVKKEKDQMKVLDSFDTGADTADDTLIGGLVGSLCGILAGPLGVLLMGSYGAMVGSLLDMDDALTDASLIEQIAGKLQDNEVAIIGLASEEDEAALDAEFGKFKTTVMRYDAAVVAAEVDAAQEVADEMARQARIDLRNKKKAEFKAKVDEKRAKISSDFEAFKKKLSEA